ncbi:PTS sugar transporter subunit IIA [Candidatus Enterococcus ferrettii]|uniref:PTS system, mannose-specific IIA component n=1 Tax=Candidatus Enterococcus ferrettii TaxID=2815324 RepID=A0ABV0EN69_9ENTE|nr:PTS fructose transporter subunit IIA [Enterococcus sp. 665A]MBO1339058.1 PTS fructose transporter subunit IIA [Enterococcus sp. 665A]
MKKLLIASHGDLAKGMLSSIEMITGSTAGITTINAYQEAVDLDSELTAFIHSLKEEDEVFVFTDLYGGSVNQKITERFIREKQGIRIVSGFNFPVILEILLGPESIDSALLVGMIEKARNELQVNVLDPQQAVDDSEEDFFI